jgi:RNA recognition motif-containing protein
VKELSKKLYVGNLAFSATEAQVRELFEQFGTVESVAMITDRDTGRFRGFSFVEMEESAANAAIKGLNGQFVEGRELRVDAAKPKSESGRSSSKQGGGRQGGYGNSWQTNAALSVSRFTIGIRNP